MASHFTHTHAYKLLGCHSEVRRYEKMKKGRGISHTPVLRCTQVLLDAHIKCRIAWWEAVIGELGWLWWPCDDQPQREGSKSGYGRQTETSDAAWQDFTSHFLWSNSTTQRTARHRKKQSGARWGESVTKVERHLDKVGWKRKTRSNLATWFLTRQEGSWSIILKINVLIPQCGSQRRDNRFSPQLGTSVLHA